MAAITGGSFTGRTITVNETDAVAPSGSRTVIVITVAPNRSGAGVTRTVRLDSVPVKTMFVTGTRFVIEDTALTVSKAAGVSTSPRMKGSAAVGVSSSTVTFGSVDRNGASFSGVMVTVKLRTIRLFDGVLSLTVTVMVATPLELSAGVKPSAATVGLLVL